MQNGLIPSGARCVFSINGAECGWATQIAVSESIDYQPVEVIGNIEVEEYAPIGYNVTFTASFFRIIGTTLKSMGWFPKTGNSTDEHLSNILTNGDLSMTVEDRTTGKIICTLEQVKIASHNWTIAARGLVGEDCTFNAIRCRDESEV